MIGRLKPIHNILDSTDRITCRAHYCGLCITTRKVYGIRATLGHSSEMVFVSMLLEGLSEQPYEPIKAKCPVLPLLKRNIVTGPSHHCRALATGVLTSLQLDLKDAREDRERRLKQFLCKKLITMESRIPVEGARLAPVIRKTLHNLSKDGVADVVAGVVGTVFHLAEFEDSTVEIGCRIGHAMGRLMSYSDAVDDYFDDLRAGRESILGPVQCSFDIDWIEDLLHEELDIITHLLGQLPLRHNARLLDSLINVHARARVNATLNKFREKFDKRGFCRANGTGSPSQIKRFSTVSNKCVSLGSQVHR
jgi:hypothetical protein